MYTLERYFITPIIITFLMLKDYRLGAEKTIFDDIGQVAGIIHPLPELSLKENC